MSDANEGQYRNELARAARAQRILTDDLFVEAFSKLEARLIADWRITTDQAQRDRLWLMQALLVKLLGYIEEVMNTGKLASKSLVDMDERKRAIKARRTAA